MTIRDFSSQRLFIGADLPATGAIDLDRDQTHYLVTVLRQKPGDRVLVFNGRDGEWAGVIASADRKSARLTLTHQTRPQVGGPDITYLFAPLKRARLDYMVQKATELGVARLCPVLTRFTQAERVNLERMRANMIEAAEQCGILRLPEVLEPVRLEVALARLGTDVLLVFCDEAAETSDPIKALQQAAGSRQAPSPVAVLIGPEGGFSADERELLLRRSPVVRLSLGPRIMRADTAAVAALALVNATLADWC
ncbi:MAG: 16S rRNA (uracil(1498)-N(3))-methyltransferase [Hyphomicrobiaceae bacterium]